MLGRAGPGLGDAQHVVRGVLFEEERPLSSVEILFSIWQEDPDNVRPLLNLPRRAVSLSAHVSVAVGSGIFTKGGAAVSKIFQLNSNRALT